MSIDRILAHVCKNENGCWAWTGAMDKTNPMLRVSQPTRKIVSARRYAYEVHNQVCVPSDFVVTAICKDSKCVNPAHLTAVKRGKQGHRLIGDWKSEHCQRGHEFSTWNTGKSNSGKVYCLACDRAKGKEYAIWQRTTKPEYVNQLRVNRVKEKKKVIDALKALITCKMCGESDPNCLDFHHIDSSTKIATVSMLVSNQRKLDTILEELKKCLVLCANCHRKLHASEKINKEVIPLDKLSNS